MDGERVNPAGDELAEVPVGSCIRVHVEELRIPHAREVDDLLRGHGVGTRREIDPHLDVIPVDIAQIAGRDRQLFVTHVRVCPGSGRL